MGCCWVEGEITSEVVDEEERGTDADDIGPEDNAEEERVEGRGDESTRKDEVLVNGRGGEKMPLDTRGERRRLRAG